MEEYITNTLRNTYQPPPDGGYLHIQGGNVNHETIIQPKLLDLSSDSIKAFDSNTLNSLFLFGNDFTVVTADTLRRINTLYIVVQLSDKQNNTYTQPTQTVFYIQADGSMHSDTLQNSEDTLYDGPYAYSMLMEISGKPRKDMRQFKFNINNTHRMLFSKLNQHISAELLHKTLNDYITNTNTPDALAGDENYLRLYDNYKTSLNNAEVTLQNQIAVLYMTYTVVSGVSMTFQGRNGDDSVTFTLDDDNSTLVINLFKKLMKDEYIVTDATTQIKYVGENEINTATTTTDTNNNTITMKLRDFPSASVAPGAPFKLNMKDVGYYKDKYSENEDKINSITKELGSAFDEYNGLLKTMDTVQTSFKYVDMYKYLMYLIVTLIIAVLLLGNEEFKPMFSMLMLGIVVAIYVVFIGTYTAQERFSDDTVPTTSQLIETYMGDRIDAIQELADNIRDLVSMYEPLVAVSDMYERILHVMQKDINRLDLEHNIARNKYHISRSRMNQEWHDGYRAIAIVSALVIVSVILLGYYFLAATVPQSKVYVGVLAVIGIVFTVFYYFYKVSQNVRTRYNGFYWNR